MLEVLTRPVGTFDFARPVDQMQAIDLVLRYYFRTPDWLRARHRARRPR